MAGEFKYEIVQELGQGTFARAGIISTPHGQIQTPAFIVVGTAATVKGLTPDQVKEHGAQAVLANAYHLYLQPGPEIIEKAGGLAKFMHWDGPTFTDSGGFQVFSLGMGYKKVFAMDSMKLTKAGAITRKSQRLAHVNDEGVTFTSHIDGSRHQFTPELSMRIQHAIGADIIFAFDECTSLLNSYKYQQKSLERTHRWAQQCLDEHRRLTVERKDKPYQALFGIVQGAQHEDLRRSSAKYMGSLPFDGYGIGGSFEKSQLGDIIRWVNEELPKDKPKHLLGLSEPSDIFIGIENGCDTFDCVQPTRLGRHGHAYTKDGRISLTWQKYKTDLTPIEQDCPCYTCQNYTKAYLSHLCRANEMLAGTLASIHNVHFTVNLVANIRESILDGSFLDFKKQWLARYYKKQTAKVSNSKAA